MSFVLGWVRLRTVVVWLDPAFDKGYHGCFTENGQETSFGIIVFMLLYF